MPVLDSIIVDDLKFDKYVNIEEGDLLTPSRNHTIDVLVVSAFPNDYSETTGSVIGALARRGISVATLANDKEYDLRSFASCWLSKPLAPEHQWLKVKRILCFEPQHRGSDPVEVIADIFRALAPFVGAEPYARSIAMPLVACGDQGAPVASILAPLVKAAVHWMQTSPLQNVNIVEMSRERAQQMREEFSLIKGELASRQIHADKEFDVFISYCHVNSREVDIIEEVLRELAPPIRIFRDKNKLKAGHRIPTQLHDALRRTRVFLPVLSLDYLNSNACKDEYNTAWNIRTVAHPELFFPLSLQKAPLDDPRMREMYYHECEGGDPLKVRQSCEKLLKHLNL